MIVARPSLAFAFMLLLISHAIITGFASIYILHLVPVLFSIVIPTSFNILMKCFFYSTGAIIYKITRFYLMSIIGITTTPIFTYFVIVSHILYW